MRRILVAYLVLLTATGPSLCCCSLPRGQAGAGMATATHAPAGCPSCCHADSEQGSDELRAPTSPSEQKAPLPPPRCPCRHHAAQPAAVAQRALPVAEQEPDQSAPLLTLLHLGSQELLAGEGAEAGPGNRLHPFFWPQELLRAHHRLRC